MLAYKKKIHGSEVKIRTYEARICIYEDTSRSYGVKNSADELKSLNRKSRHRFSPHEANSWIHWADRYNPRVVVIV